MARLGRQESAVLDAEIAVSPATEVSRTLVASERLGPLQRCPRPNEGSDALPCAKVAGRAGPSQGEPSAVITRTAAGDSLVNRAGAGEAPFTLVTFRAFTAVS